MFCREFLGHTVFANANVTFGILLSHHDFIQNSIVLLNQTITKGRHNSISFYIKLLIQLFENFIIKFSFTITVKLCLCSRLCQLNLGNLFNNNVFLLFMN